MKTLKKEVNVLLQKRVDTQKKLLKIKKALRSTREKIMRRELNIKLNLDKEIKHADQATAKTKYSNTEKRRLELEKRLNEDVILKQYKKIVYSLEKSESTIETSDKIQRLTERYLFKNIDMYIAERKSHDL